MLNDLFLLAKIREGDIKAFERVFKLYYAPLCLYSAGITGDMDVAEEIVEELFYVVWRDRQRIDVERSLKSYLYGAVRKESLQFCEHEEVKNRYRDAMEAKAERGELADAHDDLEYRELQKLVEQVLQRLPERCARIFRMQRFAHRKYAEIAKELSLSVKTVEAEMTKALRTLRKEITDYYHR